MRAQNAGSISCALALAINRGLNLRPRGSARALSRPSRALNEQFAPNSGPADPPQDRGDVADRGHHCGRDRHQRPSVPDMSAQLEARAPVLKGGGLVVWSATENSTIQ